jgi:hypothetical protein
MNWFPKQGMLRAGTRVLLIATPVWMGLSDMWAPVGADKDVQKTPDIGRDIFQYIEVDTC